MSSSEGYISEFRSVELTDTEEESAATENGIGACSSFGKPVVLYAIGTFFLRNSNSNRLFFPLRVSNSTSSSLGPRVPNIPPSS